MNDKKNNKNPWWSKKWGKDKICGITQSRLRPGKYKSGIPYCTTLVCGHSFYTKPIVKWLSKHFSCPICRKEIEKISFII